MKADARSSALLGKPSFAELYTPKLITVLREGYGWQQLRADALAGLTVAIVALPLSMAIAVASGTTPERGLTTAIIGGFLVSALGGSRFQVGGPAGAFIILVAATVARHGIEGLLLATCLSGLMLLALGFLRLGTYVRLIPYPVTVGFSAGIAVIIFASQLKELFGLSLGAPEPGPIVAKLETLMAAAGTAEGAAIAVSLTTLMVIVGLRRFRPKWPGMLIAVTFASAATALLSLPVETVGSRFGGIPAGLPWPALPDISIAKVQAVLPDAVAFALLGAIESLLSAVVADGMTGRRHRSNCELVAQGVANIAAGLFGGICTTGTIARTATNVRAGAHGPVAGMLHALILLIFLLVAAPLASFIPLAALGAVLAFVAWNMVERHAIVALIRGSRGDTLVLLSTFLLTVFRDLIEGIIVGFAIGALLFINRMAEMTGVEAHGPLVPPDQPDAANGGREAYDPHDVQDQEVAIYRIRGALFFAAAAHFESILDRIGSAHKVLILDFDAVPFLDSTAAQAIEGQIRKAERRGVKVFLSGLAPAARRNLISHNIAPPRVTFAETIDGALATWREQSAQIGMT